jgi:thiol-disulfide isomerase/thioredoxin
MNSYATKAPIGRVTFLILLFILEWGTRSIAQSIQFREEGIDQLVAEAKRQDKLVFVEIFLNGCSHCEALAPVLDEKKVGDFYNATFVSAKYEANSPLSKALQETKKIGYAEFPLLLFFDADGQLIHQATPTDKPTRSEFIQEVLRHGNDALSPATRTSGYPARYAQGDRNLDFLINYAKFAKTTRDTMQLAAINQEFGKIFSLAADLESPVGFFIISRFIDDIQHPMATYFFSHLDTYRAKFGPQPVQQAGESVLYQTLYGSKTNRLSSADIVAIRKAMESLGTPALVATQRTILKELEAYFRENKTVAAIARFDEYHTTNTLKIIDYAYLMRFFNEKAPDNTYAASLVSWINDALKPIKPIAQNRAEIAELYREQSEAYLRLGQKAEGKKAAEKAVAIAKIVKEKPETYAKQLAKFQ